MSNNVVEVAKSLSARYHGFFRSWNTTNYVLGISSVVAASVASVIPKEQDKTKVWAAALAALAGILAGALTFLKPAGKSTRFLKAHHLLRRALLRRDADPAQMNDLALAEEIDKSKCVSE